MSQSPRRSAHGSGSDLAFVGHFEPDVHDVFLSVVNLFAVADGNDGDRSGVLDEDNAPIAKLARHSLLTLLFKALRAARTSMPLVAIRSSPVNRSNSRGLP